MASIEAEPAHTEIPLPAFRDEDETSLVKNVYELPGHGLDLESQDVAGEYLMSRYEPDPGPKTRVILTPTGRTFPSIERVPAGAKLVTRWRKTIPEQWRVSPRQAVAVWLGSAALCFAAVGNLETVEKSAEWIGHKAYRVVDPVHDKTVTRTEHVSVPGKISTIQRTADTANLVGTTEVDTAVIRSFIEEIHAAEKRGGKLLKLRIRGNTSDEWGDENSIGVADKENEQLGKERAQAAVAALEAKGLHVKPSQLVESQKEHVLTAKEKRAILKEAHANGYSGIKEVSSLVDQGAPVPASLASKIKRLITGKRNRGDSLEATMEFPAKARVVSKQVQERVPGEDHTPDVPGLNLFGFLPLPWWRRRERYLKEKQIKRWEFTPSKPIFRPAILKEEVEQAWVRLRPEAIKEDGSFVDNAWAYTRLYEILMRDDRIHDCLRADYENPKGEQKSLRVMFVDHTPAKETVEAFEALLHQIAASEDGKVGDRVSGIFVYPSESTGFDHGDPRRVGLGIDKQMPENILGQYTYALDLVTLHMPATCDKEELLEMFRSANGPIFTGAHELGGHGTDESDQPLRARPVRARSIPNAHVIEGDPRAAKMAPLASVLKKLTRFRDRKAEPVEFDISYTVTDNEGKPVTINKRVTEGTSEFSDLGHASLATIAGSQPTRYAGTNDAEHYADTAASVLTGITLPFEEAGVRVPQLQTNDGKPAVFATGYRPDVAGQRLVTDSIGAIPSTFPAKFANPPKVTITRTQPGKDALLREELIRTRKLRILRPEEMKAILVRVAERKRVSDRKA